MNQANTIKRAKLIFLLTLALITVTIFFSGHRGPQAARQTEPVSSSEAATVESSPVQRQTRPNPKSVGCISCHGKTEDMHKDGDDAVGIGGCADCHGGTPSIERPAGSEIGSAPYEDAKKKAHVQPRNPELWRSSANPVRTATRLNEESDDFVRFVNPGDLRVAEVSCGGKCHTKEVAAVKKSMMTHGGMLWAAALYNNGAFPLKDARFGESYGKNGAIQQVFTNPAPTREEQLKNGVLPYLLPLPRWEITQPGNILRVFERGGEKKGLPSDIGSPNPDEVVGRPDDKLSDRGFGTRLRTDPVFLGLQKTRLLDPLLSFMGTNDNPGDYRSSGCTACHIVYANDRDPAHAGPFAQAGNQGFTQTADLTLKDKKNESGHPIKHQMTSGIPSSQCMVCHIHPGGNMVTSYFGMTWWDNETDGDLMYPKEQPKLSPEQKDAIQQRNPEGSALRGLWGQDPNFLRNIWTDVNPKAKRTQFGDFHGHGWVFRKVYKQDRKGNLLNARGTRVNPDDPDKFKPNDRTKAEQLQDVHAKVGMHCVDCHVSQDVHGNGNLYNEARAAIQIDCIDCHGTIDKRATLIASGPAAGKGKFKGEINLTKIAAARGKMFQVITAPTTKKLIGDDGKPVLDDSGKEREVKLAANDVIQNSLVVPGKWWRVIQTIDTVTEGKDDYNDASAWAKLVTRENKWGDTKTAPNQLAHSNSSMTCYACHSSWTTSCFGCHLPMTANKQKPMLHNEGEDKLRNWTQYNFQTLRDDIYMLGKDGTVTGHRVAPTRSTCAILVSSQNQNREWLYSQQQTVSSEGYSGQAFSSYVPHTVRAAETKTCSDCHVSTRNDNNAWMAQLLMQGTNFVNFIGRYTWVAAGKEGIQAVVVTERDEPQAVIGSYLHKIAYPEEYKRHVASGEKLQEAYEHHANGEALSIQVRGEYAYVANGPGGLRIYDIANIDNKGFSERITTAPVSPFGQRFYVKTKFATAVASPATTAVDPTRAHRPENQEAQNRDDHQPIHSLYGYLYVTDKYEGLILVGAATLLDGNPSNNFLKRALTFNPSGALNGASNITIAGTHAYITCDRGLVLVDINDPLKPQIVSEVAGFKNPRAVAIQFRYAFVTDEEGLKVVDVTFPNKAKLVDKATVKIGEAHGVYVARTYAYVAAGKDGLVIVDIEQPESPKIDQTFNAGGKLNDAHDVKVGMTNNSLYAYVADGKNGLRVVQLMSPEENANIYGFSPKPTPKLIATYPMGEALAISKGIDRDRAVDESGNQLSVFNRRGARPFNLEEMQRMYLRNGEVYKVSDSAPSRPRRTAAADEANNRMGSGAGLMDWASANLMHLFVALLLLVGGVRSVRHNDD